MRLIDADKIGLTNFEILQCAGDCREALKILLDKINRQPTEYDIDKVVAELYKELEVGNIAIDYGEFRLFEIVKQGGVYDDVCECRLLKGYKVLYKTSCCNVFEIENGFKFCPYCGKNIKIVGD